MAQVPAPTDPTSPSPAAAATVSEAKPTPKDTAADNSTPDSLLKQEGFGVVKLKQENLDNQKAHKNDPQDLYWKGQPPKEKYNYLLVDVQPGKPTKFTLNRVRPWSAQPFAIVELFK